MSATNINNTPREIIFSARSEGEPWRINRLYSLVGYVMCKTGIRYYDLSNELGLLALHDDKGDLYSYWTSQRKLFEYSIIVQECWELWGEFNHEAFFPPSSNWPPVLSKGWPDDWANPASINVELISAALLKQARGTEGGK